MTLPKALLEVVTIENLQQQQQQRQRDNSRTSKQNKTDDDDDDPWENDSPQFPPPGSHDQRRRRVVFYSKKSSTSFSSYASSTLIPLRYDEIFLLTLFHQDRHTHTYLHLPPFSLWLYIYRGTEVLNNVDCGTGGPMMECCEATIERTRQSKVSS